MYPKITDVSVKLHISILHAEDGRMFLRIGQISRLHNVSVQKAVTVTLQFLETQNYARKNNNLISQNFQPKTIRKAFHHTIKKTLFFIFPFKLVGSAQFGSLSVMKTNILNTHTHTHTINYKKFIACLIQGAEFSSCSEHNKKKFVLMRQESSHNNLNVNFLVLECIDFN
jgi:hypothetical protein